ncbi:unnamed protein product, partial [Amoebophrya sp. A120]
ARGFSTRPGPVQMAFMQNKVVTEDKKAQVGSKGKASTLAMVVQQDKAKSKKQQAKAAASTKATQGKKVQDLQDAACTTDLSWGKYFKQLYSTADCCHGQLYCTPSVFGVSGRPGSEQQHYTCVRQYDAPLTTVCDGAGHFPVRSGGRIVSPSVDRLGSTASSAPHLHVDYAENRPRRPCCECSCV